MQHFKSKNIQFEVKATARPCFTLFSLFYSLRSSTIRNFSVFAPSVVSFYHLCHLFVSSFCCNVKIQSSLLLFSSFAPVSVGSRKSIFESDERQQNKTSSKWRCFLPLLDFIFVVVLHPNNIYRSVFHRNHFGLATELNEADREKLFPFFFIRSTNWTKGHFWQKCCCNSPLFSLRSRRRVNWRSSVGICEYINAFKFYVLTLVLSFFSCRVYSCALPIYFHLLGHRTLKWTYIFFPFLFLPFQRHFHSSMLNLCISIWPTVFHSFRDGTKRMSSENFLSNKMKTNENSSFPMW